MIFNGFFIENLSLISLFFYLRNNATGKKKTFVSIKKLYYDLD